MRLPRYFIDRPIFAAVLSILILLLGAAASQRLPISEYPEVIPPSLTITARYPGATSETIAETVAGPLEQQMTGVPGMLYQAASCTPDGQMQLALTFSIGTDLDPVLTEVQNRIQSALPRLPEEVRRFGVTVEKGGSEFLLVAHVHSPDGRYDTLALTNYARLHVQHRLASIPGVSQALVFGAGEYSMRVWLDPGRMSSHGLTPGDVSQAIREQNAQVAAGTLAQQPVSQATGFEMVITTQGRLASVEEFEQIIVRRGELGQAVRLKDVARVELGGNTYGIRSLLDNKPAAAIPVIQAPDSNALETAKAVRAAMDEMRSTFPPGMDYSIVYDPTMFVEASIHEVQVTLLIAIALVVLVVILFLQTWRASLIPLLAVPVSLIGTFAVMHGFDFSINALSLFGLVLAIGIVVDDAIVVVENAERSIENGLAPRAAARKAMDEVSGPILATALVLCSVFIPTAFISGLSGRFYQQFALTIAFSTAISAFNSLTLSPALCALLLKPHSGEKRPGGWALGWFFSGFNKGFGATGRGYVAVARGAVRGWPVMLLVYAGLLIAAGWLFMRTPTGFIPSQDKGYIFTFARLPEGASLDRAEAVARQMTDIALAHPAAEHAVAFPGVSGGFAASSNSVVMFVPLKPFAQRTDPSLSAAATAQKIGEDFFMISDAAVFAFPPPPILGLGSAEGFDFFIQDRGNVGQKALFEARDAVLGACYQDPRLNPMSTYSFATMGVPRVALDIDREKAAAQGVAMRDIYDALQGYLGSQYVNDFNLFGRTWQVTMQADAPYRTEQADFERIRVRGRDGVMVPLTAFATSRETAGADMDTHYNTYPAISISSGAAPGVSVDEARRAIEEILAKNLPAGVSYEFTGLAYQQQLAGNTAVLIFPICVLLVLMVLAAFYESLTLPLAIVMIVPMCLLSALIGVWAFGGDNNIMTQIGLIVLVGLACKNAILIVEFAKDAEIHRGMSPFDAALEACRLRLRPILMTSLAFIMGVVPLVWSHGAGAELRAATGVAVFAGMIGVTVFGLLLTPVFYVVLRRLTGSRPLRSHDHDEDPAPTQGSSH